MNKLFMYGNYAKLRERDRGKVDADANMYKMYDEYILEENILKIFYNS